MDKKSLDGKGPRPIDPYVRIMWAAKKGVGITLSAKEVHDLSFDDAIATVACGVLDDQEAALDTSLSTRPDID